MAAVFRSNPQKQAIKLLMNGANKASFGQLNR